jgi:hypothetical protein
MPYLILVSASDDIDFFLFSHDLYISPTCFMVLLLMFWLPSQNCSSHSFSFLISAMIEDGSDIEKCEWSGAFDM